MPMIECHHCGESTFTISGWADVDHCATCGRPLSEHRIEIGAVLGASERLEPRPRETAGRRGASKDTGA